MHERNRRIIIGVIIGFVVLCIALVIYFLFVPKTPSTQTADKTVIINNYADYTAHISSDSMGYLGNYLYEFINNPDKGVYHGVIVKDSYTYSSDSWFSKFVVQLNDSDISWNVSLQTTKSGEINGDIAITCKTGGDKCLSTSDRMNSTTNIQDLLPLTTNDFIISYQTDDYDKLSVVYYDQAGTGKTKALEKIRDLGFNPEDYTIEYFYGGR